MGFGIKPKWGIIVTFSQILQMFLGLYFLFLSGGCSTMDTTNYYFGISMYLSYVYLFIEFFVKKYVFGSKKGKQVTKEEIKKE
jgi:hypothetical protein